MRDLSRCCLENPAFYEKDYDREGFCWVDCHQEEKCVYVFERKSREQTILAVFNFSDQEQTYVLESEEKRKYTLLLASDMEQYGGGKKYRKKEKVFETDNTVFELTPFSARYYMVL